MNIPNIQLNGISFDGGMNNTDASSEIADNEISKGQNRRLVGTSLQDRGGSSKLNSTAAGSLVVTGTFNVPIAGTHYLIVFYSDGTVFRESAGSRTEITNSGADYTSGTDIRWTYTSLQDGSGDVYALFFNGTDTPQKWNPGKDSGKMTDIDATITVGANYCATFGDRLWYFEGLKGYFTGLLDCTDGDEVNNVHEFPDDGSEGVISAFVFKGYMFVCTAVSIHQVEYTSDANSPFHYTGEFFVTGHGYYNWSVEEVYSSIVALATDGHFYVFDGINEYPIDGKVKKYTDDITDGRRAYSWAQFYPEKKEYIISVDMGTASANDTLLSINFEYGLNKPRFNTKWTGRSISSLALLDSSGTKKLYGGCSDAVGFVYQLDTGSLDGTNSVNAWFETKKYGWGTTMLEKRFLGLNPIYESVVDIFSLDIQVKESGNNYNVSLSQDGDYLAGEEEQDNDFWLGDDDNLGSWLVGEAEVPDTFVELVNDNAYTMQLKVISQGVNSTSKLRKILVQWMPLRYR